MKTYESILDAATALAEEVIAECSEVSSESLGLDRRAGWSLLVGEDFIAVPLHNDGALQYYGGFEYVEKSLRMELGGYVFYSVDDSRVAEHHGRASG